MNQIFLILGFVSMLSVLGVLIAGLVTLGKGGEFEAKYSNKLMRMRVALQGLAFVCFMIAIFAPVGA